MIIGGKKAVIFDMDGVLVDSEPLWKQAEEEVFSSLGVKLNKESTEITKSMTTSEVAQFWYNKFPWKDVSISEAEEMVINKVSELVESNDCQVEGISTFIHELKSRNFKIGLATNSPYSIIPKVLRKLKVDSCFDAICSSEFEESGKPDPSVYISAAQKLQVSAPDCIAIEDSYSGMLAAKRAGMTVIAFTPNTEMKEHDIADYSINNFSISAPFF